MIWDTGSSDNTLKIIEKLKKNYPKKISFKQVGEVKIDEFTKIRQQMLEHTQEDWVLVVDGDEVWWDEKIQQTANLMRTQNCESIVSGYTNLVGDMYHTQPNSASKYEIDGVKGPITIRAMNREKIEGLNAKMPHGKQGYFDQKGILVQDRAFGGRIHVKGTSYLHMTHLIRSESLLSDRLVPKRSKKYKAELGVELPLDFYYPEAFFKSSPEIVKSVWKIRSVKNMLLSTVQTPMRSLKRSLPLPSKSGY